MPVETNPDPTNPRIIHWLEEVKSFINQGSLLCSEEAEKSESWTCKEQNRSLTRNRHHPTRDIRGKNKNVEYLNLETPYLHSRGRPLYLSQSKATTLTLPKIEEVIPNHLHKLAVGAKLEKTGKNLPMDSMIPLVEEEFDCQVSLTENVDHLCIHDEKRCGILQDNSFKKDRHFMKRTGTPVNNNNRDPFLVHKNGKTDVRFHQNNFLVDTQASSCFDEEKVTLPSLTVSDMRSNAALEVPRITVFKGEETRASESTQQELSLDPRFLMPTEASVEEARYLLASRRRSLPTFGRSTRTRSLDMVVEDQTIDATSGDRTLAPSSSLRVPRRRSRSRSLDNSVETRTSFAAFKESLKMRNVKNNVLGS